LNNLEHKARDLCWVREKGVKGCRHNQTRKGGKRKIQGHLQKKKNKRLERGRKGKDCAGRLLAERSKVKTGAVTLKPRGEGTEKKEKEAAHGKGASLTCVASMSVHQGLEVFILGTNTESEDKYFHL